MIPVKRRVIVGGLVGEGVIVLTGVRVKVGVGFWVAVRAGLGVGAEVSEDTCIESGEAGLGLDTSPAGNATGDWQAESTITRHINIEQAVSFIRVLMTHS